MINVSVRRALHRAILFGALVLAAPVTSRAQALAAVARPFEIMDNSFLVEEAFNQERGVVQNIFGATRMRGAWAASFTQEWPVASQAHQFSYTVPWLNYDSGAGAGDVLLNYRYQLALEGPRRAAISPRLSLILPTGSREGDRGTGAFGVQVNVPVSKQVNDWYLHWNSGVTWVPRAQGGRLEDAGQRRRAALVSPFVAASAIYRLRPMLNLMLETVVSSDDSADTGSARQTTFTLSPGVRGGWNVGDQQIVLGLAAPVSWTEGDGASGAFVYFSYELPFRKK